MTNSCKLQKKSSSGMSGEAERNAEDGEHTCAVCLETMLPPVLPPTAPEQAPLLDSPEMESATLR